MKRARFTEEQIIAVLKEHEAGAKTADLARKHGIPKGPFVVASDPNEIDYRRLLGLPEAGALLKSEIAQAFRIRARNAHPDSGGSHEDFQKLGRGLITGSQP